MIIGSHVSFTKDEQLLGSVKEAISYGANALMLYTGAPQNTRRSRIDANLVNEAIKLMQEHNIDINHIICHAPYIINLANRENIHNYEFSIDFLRTELDRCMEMGIKYLVVHPGSHVNHTKIEGINNIINALNKVIKEDDTCMILLETMAGKGNEVGKTFEELSSIIDLVKIKDKIGVCLDTCHLNDAGYDISNFDKVLDEFDKIIGIDKIGCIHVNDSINNINSHKDRHANIGFGTLGFDNLIGIIYNKRLENIPKILETPYVTKDDSSKERLYPPYKYEIEMIKNKMFDNNLITNIRKDNDIQ